MLRLPPRKQITGAVGARFGRAILAIRAWWRGVQADPDRRANLFFLCASSLLTAATIGGFLWLTGILDWRGSNGRTTVELIFTCDGKPGAADYDACVAGFESGNRITALLNLKPRYETRDSLDIHFDRGADGDDSAWPRLTKATRLQIISTRPFEFPEYNAPKNWRVTYLGGDWYSTSIQPAASTTITFAHRALMRYTGLSERELSIRLNFLRGGSMLHGEKTLTFTLVPPDDFDVVEASPPAERSGDGYA
jgi:hypothetical protein